MIFVEPESAYLARIAASRSTPPSPLPLPTPPKLDWLEQRILDNVRDCEPAKYWSILNLVSEEMAQSSREQGRAARMQLVTKMQRLIDLGLVFRIRGNMVATYKPAPIRAAKRKPRRRKPTVGITPAAPAVSKDMAVPTLEVRNPPQAVKPQTQNIPRTSNPPTRAAGKTQSALSAELVTAAARELATLPRNQPRKYTGWLHGQHCWRGRLLVMANGMVLPLVWCQRGRVITDCHCFSTNFKSLAEEAAFLRVWTPSENQIALHKSPAAVLLGRLKAGVSERPSAAKSAAARRNGAMLVRPGSRPRGRPRGRPAQS